MPQAQTNHHQINSTKNNTNVEPSINNGTTATSSILNEHRKSDSSDDIIEVNLKFKACRCSTNSTNKSDTNHSNNYDGISKQLINIQPHPEMTRPASGSDIVREINNICELNNSSNNNNQKKNNLCVLVNKKNNQIDILSDENIDMNKLKLVKQNQSISIINNNNSDELNNGKDDKNVDLNAIDELDDIDNDDVLVLRLCDLERVTRRSQRGKRNNARKTKTTSSNVSFHKCNGTSPYIIKEDTSFNRPAIVTNRKTTKSIGTQYNCSLGTGKQQNSFKKGKHPLTPQTNAAGPSSANSEIIFVSDEFRRNAINQHKIDVINSKRKILKMMKLQKNHSSRSMDDVRMDDLNVIEPVATGATNQTIFKSNKAISKSVNNVSNDNCTAAAVVAFDIDENEDGVLADVGSVELIFISNEGIHDASKSNVIILNTQTGPNKKKKKSIDISNGKEVIYISDDFRQNSIKDNNVVVVMNDTKGREKLKNLIMNKNSSQETSIDDVTNKMTSHAFHSYDEEQEDLERKFIEIAPTK